MTIIQYNVAEDAHYFFVIICAASVRDGMEIKMSYEKPEVKEFEMPLEIKTMASEIASYDGGHCVRTRYEGDH